MSARSQGIVKSGRREQKKAPRARRTFRWQEKPYAQRWRSSLAHDDLKGLVKRSH